MERSTFKVLKSRNFIWPLFIVSLIIAIILAYFLSVEDKIIFPNIEGFKYEYYTDKANRGNSEVLEYIVSDSVIKIDFNLKEGFFSPYVGISISPVNEDFISVRGYNQINLQLKGINIERLGISLYNPPVATSKGQDEALFHTYLNISKTTKTYQLPIKQFQTPEWWNDLNQIPETQNLEPELNSILHINIGSAYTPYTSQQKALEIYSISFTRDNRGVFLALGLTEAVFIILLFVANYLVMFNKSKSRKITVLYKPLEIDEKDTSSEKCIDYINNHFNNSDLTLELVSKETGVPERQITKAIQTKFYCNFKTYINRIRINESKRFLTQTDLNMGEIAYKIGFNSQSHLTGFLKASYKSTLRNIAKNREHSFFLKKPTFLLKLLPTKTFLQKDIPIL